MGSNAESPLCIIGFRYAVDIIICIDLFGACCVYQIIIAKTIKQLIENEGSAGVNSEDLPHLRLYILALLVPVLLLCMIRSLKYLAPFTLIADIFIGKILISWSFLKTNVQSIGFLIYTNLVYSPTRWRDDLLRASGS